MKETTHIAIPVDGEYRRWGEVAARSAQRGASLPVEIHWIDWSVCDRAKLESLGRWHGSAIAWSRLYLAEILPPDVDWVISCDADVLFRGDVARLWALRDERFVVMMSRDSLPSWHKENPAISEYAKKRGLETGEIFCSGITLINLRRWRDEGWQAKVDQFVDSHRDAPFLDQIALNVVFRDVKSPLPRKWGCFSGDLNAYVDYGCDCAIHYVGDAPWKRDKLTRLMSDAVVLWRREAGMECGGWRRWVYCALRATHFFWGWNGWMAWHFRNAARKPRTALILMHRAPYRDPVARRIRKMGGVDVFAALPKDPNHDWAGFGGGSRVATLWCRWMTARMVLRFALGGKYSFVIWSAYVPGWLTIPIVLRSALGRKYAITLDGTDESGGRFSRAVKRYIFRRAAFLWVPGAAARRFLREKYGIDEGKIVEGAYIVDGYSTVRHSPIASDGVLKFLMVGNDVPIRDMDAMVEGFHAFARGRADLELTLCGKGVSRFACECVKSIEGVAWGELGGLYEAADVYVHSGAEQFSTAVQIAAMNGMPIICSKGVGIAADIDFELTVAGWRDASAWEIAFRRTALMSRDELAALGFRNGEQAKQKFDVERTADEIWRKINVLHQ